MLLGTFRNWGQKQILVPLLVNWCDACDKKFGDTSALIASDDDGSDPNYPRRYFLSPVIISETIWLDRHQIISCVSINWCTFIISYLLIAKAPQPVGHRALIPAGSAYLNYLRLSLHHNYSFDALDNRLLAEEQRRIALINEATMGEDDLGVGDEPETDELLSLDPKEWKVCVNQCLA